MCVNNSCNLNCFQVIRTGRHWGSMRYGEEGEEIRLRILSKSNFRSYLVFSSFSIGNEKWLQEKCPKASTTEQIQIIYSINSGKGEGYKHFVCNVFS